MTAALTTTLIHTALQVVVAPPAPPAPPIVYSPSPAQRVMAPAAERYIVDVEVRAGSEILWSGPLALASSQSTTFMRRLAEPAPNDCGINSYGQQIENSLNIQLSLQRQFDAGSAVGVSIRWGRSEPGTCPFRASTRVVELNQTVALAPRQSVVLTGDANLTIRLHRR